MKDYFNLQVVMTNRRLKEAGVNPLLAYLLLLFAFVLFSEFIFQKTDFAKYLVILICLSFQLNLSDKSRTEFLRSTFGDDSKRKIRILENLFVCIPFVSFLLYKNNFLEAAIIVTTSIILALISFTATFNFTIPTPFSKRPFEFTVGFRKSIFIFPFAFVLTIVALKVDNLNLGIFSMLLIFLTTLSYYAKPEHDHYVWVHAQTPKVFLKNKLLTGIKNAFLLASPILISLFVFYPSEFKLILGFLVIGLLFVATIILAKYSVYPSEMNLLEGILIAFSIYFPPLLLVIIPFFFTKSLKNLKTTLND